jgi:hypothetical protein
VVKADKRQPPKTNPNPRIPPKARQLKEQLQLVAIMIESWIEYY